MPRYWFKAAENERKMGWTHIEDKQVKTRVQHVCFLCGDSIPIGDTVIRRTGVMDNVIQSTYMHRLCEKATWDWDWMDWETFSFGELPPEALEGITLD